MLRSLLILKYALLGCLTSCCLSCSQPKAKPQGSAAAAIAQPDASIAESQVGCVKGNAIPLADKNVYPHSHFQLLSDSTGIETIDIGDGDSLIIRNWGWESYNLTFSFITARYKAATVDTQYWCTSAIELMERVANGINSPARLTIAAKALRSCMEKDHGAAMFAGEEVTYDTVGIPAWVRFDFVKEVESGKYKVVLTCSIGPL